jgi:hypothetical protein
MAMRRLMLAFAVTATLALAMTAPAAAAPYKNPVARTFTVTCGSDSWNVLVAADFVRWPVDGPVGTTPDKAVGGTITWTSGDVTVAYSFGSPPGLADKVQTCSAEGPLESLGYHVVVDPLYLKLTPH